MRWSEGQQLLAGHVHGLLSHICQRGVGTAGRTAPGGNSWSQSTAVPGTKPAARPYRDPCQVGLGLQQPRLFPVLANGKSVQQLCFE